MAATSQPDAPIPLRIRIEIDGERPIDAVHRDRRLIRIGRESTCDVPVSHPSVSRRHVDLAFENGAWVARDAGSTNGTWLDGRRMDGPVGVRRTTRLHLGHDGPVLEATPEPPSAAPQRPPARPTRRPDAQPDRSASTVSRRHDRTVDDYIRHYVRSDDADAGEHTIMVRRAVATVQKTQRRRWTAVVAGVALVAVVAAVVAWQKHQEVAALQRAANDLFAQMKELDLGIAQVRAIAETAGDARIGEQLARLETSRSRLVKTYEDYLGDLRVYDKVSPEDQLIYRVARGFNESEMTMPPEFLWQVKETISSYWQSPAGRDRFLHAVQTAERNGRTAVIARALQAQGLTPRFFYLAMQESNFNVAAVGPPTRYGRAKGMWQFIPSTAVRFGLYPGAAPDADGVELADERCDFGKATNAAARYLQTIYGTLAQASGLLVVASYNWGEGRIVTRLSDLANPQGGPDPLADLPEDPAARSYWRFFREFRERIPAETRDYVLKVFSAAVIGEDPARFGFAIENPLAAYLGRETAPVTSR